MLTEAQFNVASAFYRVVLGERRGAISASAFQIIPDMENSLFGCRTMWTHTSQLGVPGLEGDQLGNIWLLQTEGCTIPSADSYKAVKKISPKNLKSNPSHPRAFCVRDSLDGL